MLDGFLGSKKGVLFIDTNCFTRQSEFFFFKEVLWGMGEIYRNIVLLEITHNL